MAFHWSDGPSQINEVVTVGGLGSAPTTASLLAGAKVAKKASKAPIKGKGSKGKVTGRAERVVGFELVFTSRVTGAQLTVRIPAMGAFHDPKRPTTLSDVKRLGETLAVALNEGLHDTEKGRPR
jgi:hypothetical protein